ncbi:uncharacterized protein LOC114252394, partial [Bombyx mandarina]|uniref:Uncharacterized protein LOC114252394 n=1 Tax=Bombyx mandarina TaxID=7092 RepID=A0A6J2KR99_BOMMA
FLGTIFCLGTAPEDVKPVIEQQLGAFSTEDQLQLGILKHIFTILTGEVPSDLDETLHPHTSWSEKIDAYIKMMAGRIIQTKEYVKAIVQSVYARILSIKQYDSSNLPKLKSTVVLLRSPGYSSTSSASSYVTEDLSAPLCDAAKDVRCAAIINNNLSTEILEEFKTKNLCDSFVIKFDDNYYK